MDNISLLRKLQEDKKKASEVWKKLADTEVELFVHRLNGRELESIYAEFTSVDENGKINFKLLDIQRVIFVQSLRNWRGMTERIAAQLSGLPEEMTALYDNEKEIPFDSALAEEIADNDASRKLRMTVVNEAQRMTEAQRKVEEAEKKIL